MLYRKVAEQGFQTVFCKTRWISDALPLAERGIQTRDIPLSEMQNGRDLHRARFSF